MSEVAAQVDIHVLVHHHTHVTVAQVKSRSHVGLKSQVFIKFVTNAVKALCTAALFVIQSATSAQLKLDVHEAISELMAALTAVSLLIQLATSEHPNELATQFIAACTVASLFIHVTISSHISSASKITLAHVRSTVPEKSAPQLKVDCQVTVRSPHRLVSHVTHRSQPRSVFQVTHKFPHTSTFQDAEILVKDHVQSHAQ